MLKLRNLLALSVVLSALMFWGCQNEQPVEPKHGSNQLGFTKLTIPAGATITSATFYANVVRARGEQINLHRITSPWGECLVTWNTRPSFDAAIEGSFTAAAVGWYTVDVTSLVNSWLDGTYANYGILLKKVVPSEQRDEISSRESGIASYLEVCWTLNGGSDCDTTRAVADTYVRQVQPDNNFCGALTVNMGFEFQTTLDKYGLVQFDFEQAPALGCETSYAFGGDAATCFIDIPNINSNNWGWTNLITEPGTYDWPIYAGAGQCDISRGTLVGNLHVVYAGGEVTITRQIDPGFTLGDLHTWVGTGLLPLKKGVYTTAPGQFNYNGLDPVVVTIAAPFYIAAHSGVCGDF